MDVGDLKGMKKKNMFLLKKSYHGYSVASTQNVVLTVVTSVLPGL